MVTAAMKFKDAPWKKSYDQPRHHIKKQGNVVLCPPQPVAKCDRCKNLYNSDEMKLYKLKKPTNGEEYHLLCKGCAEKFKKEYRE